MKRQQQPALLKVPERLGDYTLEIELTGGVWVKIQSNHKELIEREYQRLRTGSTYGERWITEIRLL